jgi:protocatechuate 3,4-dioxygenase beta subunit
MPQDSPKTLTRRDSLITLAVTATGLMIPRAALAQDTSQLLMGSDVCSLVPETTEGPYYVADRMIRSDIREDRDGQPLLMRMQVVDPRCAPIEGARVDIWHCDAQGTYSAFGDGRGETFLRGTQMADARGVVEFTTIYPGWYPGRTVHIHFKVYLDAQTLLTGQIFFDDGNSEAIYASDPAYARSDRRRVVNRNDGIARRAGEASVATLSRGQNAYLAQLIVGVRDG